MAPDDVLRFILEQPVHRTTLSNGLTFLCCEDCSADLVTVQVWVKTGSIHEGSHLGSGLSHYLEHMLFKGTARRGCLRISADVQSAGGNINAYTTFDRTVYYIDAPSQALDLSLDVLADMTLAALLPENEAAMEKDVILREIDMDRDEPGRQVTQGLLESAFRVHPYRYPIIGYRPLFEGVSRDDLAAYYHDRYAPNNFVVVVAGAVDYHACLKLVEKHFGKAPRRRLSTPLIQPEPPQLAGRQTRLSGDVEVVRGALAFQVPGLAAPDAPALDVLAMALGHGTSSVLWQTLREQERVVHHVDASNWNPGERGLFWISYTCDPGKRAAAEAGILRELDRVAREGLPAPVVEKARRQAIAMEVNARKTMAGQASRLASAEVVLGDLGYPAVYFSRLAEVRAESLGDLSGRFLRPDSVTAASMEPAKAARPRRARKATRGLPGFDTVIFPNGLRVLLQPYDFPKVCLRSATLGGPVFEAPGEHGATALLATLLGKDTRTRAAKDVAETIESVGGTLTEFSGNNSFGVGVEVLPSDTVLGAELFTQALLEPAFVQRTFDTERDHQIAAIREERDEVVDFGRRALRHRFFGDHPYRHEPIGEIDDLRNLKPDALKALRARLLCGKSTAIAVCGAFDRAEVLRLLEPLGSLPANGAAHPRIPFSGPVPGDEEEFLEREQAVVFEAYPDVPVTDPEYRVGEVLDELFSGMSSHLFVRVREEKGLAYFVGSQRISGLRSGMFYFCAGTSPRTVPQVQEEIAAEVARVVRGDIQPDEVERCRVRLKAQKRMGLQAPGSRALQAALNAIYGLPVNAWLDYDAEIDAVDAAALQRFARRHFKAQKRVRLVVRPPTK